MRGKGSFFCVLTDFSGITPAYAGKSEQIMNFKGKFKGSPPPMRGKGTYMDETISIYRITPAYAGKSFG